MKKICWLDINSSYSHSSSALPFIEAQQIHYEQKYLWSVVKGTLKSDIRQVVSEVVNLKPDIIAYTSWLFTCDMVHQILSRVKALLPNVIIIGGGPEYLGDNQSFLTRNSYVDYVVRGEGETSFYSLLEYIFSERRDVCQTEGACYITHNGEYIDNSIARVMNFSKLELPEQSQFFDWQKPFIQLETTRGCFNSCTFCVSGNDKPIRGQSIQQVGDRIKTISENGIKDVRVLDRTFNSNPKRAIEMLELFGNYPNMNFHLELHPALLTAEVMSAIRALPKGVLHIEAGIQSLDDTVLKACGRSGEKQRALEGLTNLCNAKNIETHTDLIAGLPFYTIEQIYKDVKTLAEIDAGEIQLESLKLLPGTAMKQSAKEFGIVYCPISPYEVLETEHISMAGLSEAMVLSRILDFYYNNPAWHEFFKKLINQQDVFLQNITQYFIEKDCYNQPLSQEKQGLILYEFLTKNYSEYLSEFTVEWIKNGLSLRKAPTLGISSRPITIDNSVKTFIGEPTNEMRIYHFSDSSTTYIFGFDRAKQHSKPTYFGVREK